MPAPATTAFTVNGRAYIPPPRPVVVLGRRTPEYHDLNALEDGLRSHGGRYEEMVPLIFSRPLKPHYQTKALADPRNFDVFDFTLNGLQH